MIDILLYLALGSFMALVILTVYKEIACYLSLRFYRDQGINVNYVPWKGFTHFITLPSDKPKKDQLVNLKEKLQDCVNKGEDIFVCNKGNGIGCEIIPVSTELIREFYAKEAKFLFKEVFIHGIALGYFDTNGPDAMDKRRIFKQFFKQSNMQKIAPGILSMVIKRLRKLRDDKWTKQGVPASEWQQVDFKELQKEIMADIIDLLLMGEEEPYMFGDDRISLAIVRTMEGLREFRNSVTNQLSWGNLYHYFMYPGARKLINYYGTIEEECYQLYLKRFENRKELGVNMIDFIVAENRQLPEAERWSKNYIIGNINIFQVAGAGTTLNTGTTVIDFLSKNKDIQTHVRKMMDRLKNGQEEIKVEDLMEDVQYDEFLKEIFRRFGSTAFSVPRYFVKNCKIGKYKFRKGDTMLFPLNLRHDFPQLFSNPLDFDLDRFKEENLHKIKDKIDYNPFSVGYRDCIGRYLAKLFQACIIGGMVSEFEIDVDGSVEHILKLGVGYGMNRCVVKLRPNQG